MSSKSDKRQQEIDYRSKQVPKKIITVQNDTVRNLPAEEKLSLLFEIEDMGDWRGLYEDMYLMFFDDSDNQVRRLATEAFWDFPNDQYVAMLFEAASKDEDEEVRAASCSALGRYIYEGFVSEEMNAKVFKRVRDFLLKFVKDEEQHSSVRRRCLESLSYDTSDDITALIETAYKQDSIDWKATAVLAMGRSHQKKWHRTIVKELGSNIRRMRIEAAAAACEGYVQLATPQLCELTRAPDKQLKLLAIKALPFTRGSGAVEALEACTLDLDLEVVETADKAIEDYFGLEEEEISAMDKVDVRLGTVSDIPILDSSGKPQNPAKQDPAKQDPAKQDPAKQDPAKQEDVTKIQVSNESDVDSEEGEEPEEEEEGEMPPELAAEQEIEVAEEPKEEDEADEEKD